MKPFFLVDTAKAFEEACSDLKTAVSAHGFGLLAVHDLAALLRTRNIDFSEDCRVFEVCNPDQAAKVLQLDMSLSMALPCRISVFTEAGQAKIGMIRPVDMLKDLSGFPELMDVAREVDSAMAALILEAASSVSVSTRC